MKPKILQDISAALRGNLPTDTVEVRGHQFLLGLLTPEQDAWTATKIDAGNTASLVWTMRYPTLACAVRAIDGQSIEDMWPLSSEEDEDKREQLRLSDRKARIWRQDKMHEWLLYETESSFLNELWGKYEKLQERYREALKSAENFSKTTL